MSAFNGNISTATAQGLGTTPIQPREARVVPNSGGAAAPSLFRDQLNALQQTPFGQPISRPAGLPLPMGPPEAAPAALKFSNHAIDRMRTRGIHFSPDDMGKIQNGVAKAEAKGARNTLLLTEQAAMIVSIKDKTVVTVMDKAQLKENVFTNIDSTIMV